MALLEDQSGDAERRTDRQQVGDHADRRQDRRLQRDEQQQEPEREHDADDQRGLGAERRFEVVGLGDRAADEGARRQLGTQAVDRCADRGVGRVLSGDDLDHRAALGAENRGHHLGDPWVGLGDRSDLSGLPFGCDNLERAGAPGPKASWTCV